MDETIEAQSITRTVRWYDVEKPMFNITSNLDPILVSKSANTIFTLNAQNFDIALIRDWDVVWNIDPPLNNTRGSRSVSYGKQFYVYKNNWAKFTDYNITVNVTYKKL